MASSIGKEERVGIIRRFASRLKFPQLFALLFGLLLLDFIIPDPLPYVDEVILGILTVMLGMWRRRSDEHNACLGNRKDQRNRDP